MVGDYKHLPPFQRGLGAVEVRYENRAPLCWENGKGSSIEYWGSDTVWATRDGKPIRDGSLCLVQPSHFVTSPMWIRFDSTKMRWIPEQTKLLATEVEERSR